MGKGDKYNVSESVLNEYNDFSKVKLYHTKPLNIFNAAFDGTVRSLVDYIDYSVKKFNQYTQPPEDSEDWEVHLALPNVRNKLMAILARLSAQRVKGEFFPQNQSQISDKIISKIVSYLVEWSDDVSNQDLVNLEWMFETALKGTGILLEDYYKYSREIKEIKSTDPETGKSVWKKKKITEDMCYSKVVPLEEFYVWNIRQEDIQKQYKVYWATTMDFEDFKRTFKKYPKSKDVLPGGSDELNKTFYSEFLSDLPGGSIGVLRMWCQDKDEFRIFANGVELTEEDNPIPFKHKKYPFSKGIYEPLLPGYFYGKSLPDKCGNLSDSIDQLFNDLFNRNKIQLRSPLIANKDSVFADTIWRPDNIIYYEGEKPESLDIKGSNQDFNKLYDILNSQLNTSTVSPISQGQPGSRSTAREIILAEEHANELIGLFLRFMEIGEKQRLELRVSNLLQFQTNRIQELSDENFSKAVRVFKQYGIMLENGTIGTREIRLKDPSQITSPEILEKEYKKDYEIFEISTEFIRDLNLYIKIIPNSSVKISVTLKKALDIEYAMTMVKLFSSQVNMRELAVDVTESYDKDPNKLLVNEQTQSQESGWEQEVNGENTPETSSMGKAEQFSGNALSQAGSLAGLGTLAL